MNRPKLRIELAQIGQRSRVWIDEKEISSIVTSIDVHASVDSVSTATVHVTAIEGEIEGYVGTLEVIRPEVDA